MLTYSDWVDLGWVGAWASILCNKLPRDSAYQSIRTSALLINFPWRKIYRPFCLSSCSKVDQELHSRVSLHKLSEGQAQLKYPTTFSAKESKTVGKESRYVGSQAIGQEPRNLTKSLKCSHFYPPSSVNPFAVKLKRKEDLVDMIESPGKK